MPTSLIVGPYRFFFVSLDYGEPPHVHVQPERMVAKFWLDPIILERGGLKPKELNQIAALVQEHQRLFLKKWHEHFDH